MNRTIRFAITLLAMLVLLTSCNQEKNPDPTPNLSQTDEVSETVSQQTEPLTTAPPATEPPQTDPPKTQEISYPKWEGHDDIELLSNLDLSMGAIRSASVYGDQVLLSYTLGYDSPISAHAQLFNLKTGELSQAVELSHPDYVAEFLGNGNICVHSMLESIAEVYTVDGVKTYTYMDSSVENSIQLDPAGGGVLWSSSWNSPLIRAIPLDGAPMRSYNLPVADGYITGFSQGVAYYDVWNDGEDSVYALLPDGEIDCLENVNGYYFNAGRFFTDGKPGYLYDPAQPDGFYRINHTKAMDWLIDARDTVLITRSYSDEGDSNRVQVMDYEKAVVYPALEVSKDYSCERFSFVDENAICFVAEKYDDDGNLTGMSVCRWTYLHDSVPLDVERIEFTALDTEISEAEKRIEDTYGIDVIYQPELLHLVASDYSTVAVDSPWVLYMNLFRLESALNAYPAGFFEDICYGDYTHLEVFLCGTFTPLTDAGIYTAEAIANTRGDALVIGLNVYLVTTQYSRVLAHEMMHIMEHRIDGIDFDILTPWVDLTPGGYDAYYFSYHDEYGNEIANGENTYYYEIDPEQVYFVDAYSKSYPGEDRARVFEKLMESGGDPYFADCPILMAKAQFLCQVIRENFPSVANIVRAAWEFE